MQKNETPRKLQGDPSGSPLSRLSDRVNSFCEMLLFVLMLAMVGITTLQIICRFFFTALIWSEEVTRFLLVFASLVGASVGFKRGSHIAITALRERLPSGAAFLVGLGTHLLGILFFAVLAWYGGVLMITEASQTTPGMGISMMWIYAMYPLMGCIILLHLLAGFPRPGKGA
ncbi:MAG TPA: TRAP transporter small permease [Synergistaceae bacterium]|nr:TRAP transporter small permease [Synergistaceae bacterium]HPJ25141.1 TRAP transporter small permease [Synergistaceae bacterium]HPQ36800.1 TRAP transporter small permease [Synergistaceae bacterium]